MYSAIVVVVVRVIGIGHSDIVRRLLACTVCGFCSVRAIRTFIIRPFVVCTFVLQTVVVGALIIEVSGTRTCTEFDG
jgi:hypothetical protein